MDTEKWASVAVPRDIYNKITKDANESGRSISSQLRVIYELSNKVIDKDTTVISVSSIDLSREERALEIYRLVTEKLMTFSAVGKKFNLSRERVRVIFNEIDNKINASNFEEKRPSSEKDLEGALADKYKVSRKDLERLLLRLSKENENLNFKTKIATLQLSKSLENFLELNDLIELPVSEFTENIEKLKIEKHANFSIFYLLDIIKTLENSGFESHLSKIRAHAKKLAKALTQNPS